MTLVEIAECHLKSTGSSMDAVFVDGVSKDDLDLEAVRRYMRKAVREGRRNYSEDEDPWSVLKKLKWRMGTARMDCRRRDDSVGCDCSAP